MDTPQNPENQPATTPPDAPAPSAAVSNKTVMAIVAYLGILFIVPLITGDYKDPFVKFHIKQGVVLFIVWIAVGVIASVLNSIFTAVPLSGIGLLIFPVVYLGLFVLDIVGIVNAASGRMNPLPVIGGFASMFNF